MGKKESKQALKRGQSVPVQRGLNKEGESERQGCGTRPASC